MLSLDLVAHIVIQPEGMIIMCRHLAEELHRITAAALATHSRHMRRYWADNLKLVGASLAPVFVRWHIKSLFLQG